MTLGNIIAALVIAGGCYALGWFKGKAYQREQHETEARNRAIATRQNYENGKQTGDHRSRLERLRDNGL